ncbi:hypothetical protein [Clostridium butyricum]|uniref:hypothetical protein n=1 Tax=Clostridium butyricum TaxID=1492 RepID=UPI002103B975|nr:hypothetical protein [Clostridium butyricum]MCQ2011975.1 hypothetical protein [Clostridium butyricum]MCQ2027807.1 hypothetical protein [Clostridium butyricum]
MSDEIKGNEGEMRWILDLVNKPINEAINKLESKADKINALKMEIEMLRKELDSLNDK